MMGTVRFTFFSSSREAIIFVCVWVLPRLRDRGFVIDQLLRPMLISSRPGYHCGFISHCCCRLPYRCCPSHTIPCSKKHHIKSMPEERTVQWRCSSRMYCSALSSRGKMVPEDGEAPVTTSLISVICDWSSLYASTSADRRYTWFLY